MINILLQGQKRTRRQLLLTLKAVMLCFLLASCTGNAAQFGQRGYTEEGKASYYSRKLQGKKMANGDPYRRQKLTAAHRSLPFGTKVKVTNLQTRQTVKVKITDRGPFVKGRIVDLSEAAAKKLNYLDAGVVPVKIKVVRAATPKQ